MALTITHPFVSAIADDPVAAAAGQVVPSNWNATHSISGTLPSANIAPAGLTTQVQYNLSGVLSADSGFTYAGSGGQLQLNSNSILTSPSAANLQFGAANAASPVAQTLSFQGGSGSNIASVNTTIIGSLGTGTGTNGNLIFQVGVKTTTGSTQATPTTAMTITGETLTVNFAGAAFVTSNLGIGGGNILYWGSKSSIGSPVDSVIKVSNFAGTNTFSLAATGSAAPIKFVDAGSFTANSTTATVLGSLGPSGANTTVQTWLTIVDSGGTTRYIPCF